MKIENIQPDDPRICQCFAIGLATEGPAVSVILYLASSQDNAVKAVNVCTPAEARDMAFKLWDCAKQADAKMDGFVTGKGSE